MIKECVKGLTLPLACTEAYEDNACNYIRLGRLDLFILL